MTQCSDFTETTLFHLLSMQYLHTPRTQPETHIKYFSLFVPLHLQANPTLSDITVMNKHSWCVCEVIGAVEFVVGAAEWQFTPRCLWAIRTTEANCSVLLAQEFLFPHDFDLCHAVFIHL